MRLIAFLGVCAVLAGINAAIAQQQVRAPITVQTDCNATSLLPREIYLCQVPVFRDAQDIFLEAYQRALRSTPWRLSPAPGSGASVSSMHWSGTYGVRSFQRTRPAFGTACACLACMRRSAATESCFVDDWNLHERGVPAAGRAVEVRFGAGTTRSVRPTPLETPPSTPAA
jgi:hypothetical protein